MANKYLTILSSGLKGLVEALVVSAGAADAGKIPALDSTGRLDESIMPVGIGADVATIEAGENLSAGDFVNMYDDAGTTKVRKADASAASAGKRADGFVLAGVTSGADAAVYFEGRNTQLSGLTRGTTYALSHSTPGGVVALSSVTTTADHIHQVLGKAISTTELATEISEPVVLS